MLLLDAVFGRKRITCVVLASTSVQRDGAQNLVTPGVEVVVLIVAVFVLRILVVVAVVAVVAKLVALANTSVKWNQKNNLIA